MQHEANAPKTDDGSVVHLEGLGLKDPAVYEDKIIQSSLHDAKSHRRLRHKIDRRLIPLCAWLYLLNYLDRSNIGNGKILNQETGDSLLQNLGMDGHKYSLVITLFALAYSAFDVPSNLILKRYVRPSYWLGFLCFGWGALTLGFAFLHSFAGAVVTRLFIGVFEAGFYPGIVYIITFWYRQEERSIRLALVSASSSLAGAFGGCIAYGVGHMNRKGGLEGWRWLFVFEGILTMLCTILLVFFLPNYPQDAKWLSADEKKFAVERIAEQDGGFSRERASRREVMDTCFGPRMLTHYVTYFTNVAVVSSLVYFCPTIVAGLGFSSITAQLMTVIPWALGYVVSLIFAWSADHYNVRGWLIAAASTICGIMFVVISVLPAHAYTARFACLIVACCGCFPNTAPLTAWMTCNVPSSRTMALAAAMNNTVVGIASIMAVWVWKPSEALRGFPTGNIVCATCSFATAALAVGLRLLYGRMNRNAVLDSTGSNRVWAY
ncbi:hypothetical protein A1O1_02879 [Capronia coronata CBS 617.96]|uniref:Major facilitator superfamily (MFS) profile domain-containing protein n=1 Tax=Capronia coronata CBS 617.96 TaxID=1182541 RepID=W9YPL1_9EURO|nr:uncharacterized protein A1O1_02879 [Capronia coronata CBS 617.96]EXJ94483.1 hypothetical protein A1O1_02879 [Capronia coronata CBS 617.96]